MTKRILITGGRGYIGAALCQHLGGRSDLEVTLVDSGAGRAWDWRYSYHIPYQVVTSLEVVPARFDVIVHLAAHSSVPACQDDPVGAWANNVTGFAALLDRLHPEQRLIYASSGSVYHGALSTEYVDGAFAHVSRESNYLAPPRALYDLTKRTMDDLARLSGKDCYGLRFGTVCGVSPVMRHDLMINAMVKAAREEGHVKVRNGAARRAILGMGDCVRAIEAIIDHPDRAPGVYNVASFNSTVDTIAERVARHCGVPLHYQEDTPHYDFAMDTSLMRQTFGVRFDATIESIVEEVRG